MKPATIGELQELKEFEGELRTVYVRGMRMFNHYAGRATGMNKNGYTLKEGKKYIFTGVLTHVGPVGIIIEREGARHALLGLDWKEVEAIV